MNFIIDSLSLDDDAERERRFQKYFDYLESIKEKMPPDAHAFAIANWHYDHSDHRCPHDAWVDELSLLEPASGARSEIRHIDIRVSLLGAYHDGRLELQHKRVVSYCLTKEPGLSSRGVRLLGHGDWLIDELRLSERGHVVHEIVFRNAGHWTIECEDIGCRWVPNK
jgi:hypothetical protein